MKIQRNLNHVHFMESCKISDLDHLLPRIIIEVFASTKTVEWTDAINGFQNSKTYLADIITIQIPDTQEAMKSSLCFFFLALLLEDDILFN